MNNRTGFYYRPEVDGLRAIAVFAVILFHSGLPIFKGGFIGVDVFFVVSGYLITSIILKDLKKKNFNINYFYERRARRILPALIITIFFSLFLSLYFLNGEDINFFFKSIISSLTFWSNIQFHTEADYFAKTSEFKPLLHTWSLSIEEQFYIFFPILMLIVFKINKKIIFPLILLIFFLSLFFSQWSGNLSKNYPFFDEDLNFFSKSVFSSFFLPFGRMWELALGSICAIIVNRRIYASDNLKNALSISGFSLILFSIFYFSNNFPFPSFYTLAPTFGTALIILFGFKNTIINKILSFKYLVQIGLISYSAYLFHFPIITFFKYSSIELNYISTIILIFLILGLSFLNWKIIEKPFRSKKIKLKKFLIFVFVSYMFLISISLFALNNKILDKKYVDDLPKIIQTSFELDDKKQKCLDIKKVHENLENDKIFFLGNKNKKEIDFIILGDSHILSFYKIFDNYLKNENKKSMFIGYSGCPPIQGVYSIRNDQNSKNCKDLNKNIISFLNEKKIKNIILISRWSYYTGEEIPDGEFNAINEKLNYNTNVEMSRLSFKKSIENTFQKLNDMKVNTFILEQAPFHSFHPSDAYLRSLNSDPKIFLNKLENFSTSYNSVMENHLFSKNILQEFSSKYKKVHFIEINDIFCRNKKNICKIGNLKRSFYRDKNHLNEYGAEVVKKRIINKIETLSND